jgi:hypothetical protein
MLAIKWYHIWRLRIWAEDNGSAIVIFAVLLIAAGAMSLGRTLQAGEAQEQQTVVLIATPTLGLLDPPPAPLAVANVATLSRAVIAYHDYQRPETATPLDAGRAYSVVGRAGFEWLLIDVGSGAPVWVQAFDAGLVVDGAVADLSPPPPPTPAPQIVIVREAQQQTVYVAGPPADPRLAADLQQASAPVDLLAVNQAADVALPAACSEDDAGRPKCAKRNP